MMAQPEAHKFLRSLANIIECQKSQKNVARNVARLDPPPYQHKHEL